MQASTLAARPDPYTVADILEARVLALIALGYDAKEAAQIVAETARPPAA